MQSRSLKNKKRKAQSFKQNKNSAFNYPKRIEPYRLTVKEGWITPDELRVTLPYSDTVVLASTLGVPANYLINGNGCFDPDNTGGGLQPEGFDEWSSLYTKYRVLGSRINCKPVNFSTTNSFNEFVLAPVPLAVSTITNLDNLKSSRYAKNLVMRTNVDSEVTSLCSTAAIFGIPEVAVNSEQNYSALTSANPPTLSMWLWQLAQQPVDAVSTSSISVIMLIEYDVIFYDRKALALS